MAKKDKDDLAKVIRLITTSGFTTAEINHILSVTEDHLDALEEAGED